MSDELRVRNARRMTFLQALYTRVDSSVSEFVSAFEVGEAVGLDRAESLRIIEYLEEKGLVRIDDHTSGITRLTAEGVDRVELSE